MESVENDKLIIGAYVKRNDFRDVIISNKIKSLEDLKVLVVTTRFVRTNDIRERNFAGSEERGVI